MDIARWFLGEMELAPSVWSVGGRLGYEDDGETANTQIVYQGYEKAPLIFEVRGLPENKDSKNMDKFKGAGVGVMRRVRRRATSPCPTTPEPPRMTKTARKSKSGTVPTTTSRTSSTPAAAAASDDLHADILEGHLSSALCHTGNISYRLGQQQSPDEIKEQIKAEPFAADTFERMKEHLAKNDVDVSKDQLTLGPILKMDPKTERFTSNDKADAMLKGKYREPFVVPEEV